MEIRVTPEAATWLKQELNLRPGDHLRFHTMLYGNVRSIHPNFSLGMSKEQPHRIALKAEVDGIIFYMEEQDLWYLDGHCLTVKVTDDEIDYEFTKN